MPTNQEGVQAALRAATGRALDYNGDWSALFDQAGVATGDWNSRMLAWINTVGIGTFTSLPQAQQAYAVNAGYANWSSMGTLVLFSPAQLFTGGEQGGYYDPSVLSSLFQERTGASATTPAVVGGVVGTMLDLSGGGNHLVAPTDSARPILRNSGSLYYLETDDVDDKLEVNNTSAWDFGTTNFQFWGAFRQIANAGNFKVLWAKTNNATGSNFRAFLSDSYEPRLFRGTDAQPSSASGLTATQGSDWVAMWGRDGSNDRYELNATSATKAWANIGVGSSVFKPTLFGDGAYTFGGRFYGGCVINRYLTTTETAKLKTWLGLRAGLTL